MSTPDVSVNVFSIVSWETDLFIQPDIIKRRDDFKGRKF